MARRGGYTRDVPGIEWAKLGAGSDAEGKLSAVKMGQDYFTWLNDAVMHHVYRCEMLEAKRRYQADEMKARQMMQPSPDPTDLRYQVTRPKPQITMPGKQQSSEGPAQTMRPGSRG